MTGDGASSRFVEHVSDRQVSEAKAASEHWAIGSDNSTTESTAGGFAWRDLISDDAYALIVRWETGGPNYYNKVIKGRPIWPGYSSGITIGCGYDLGYHSPAEYAADWQALIPAAAFGRLASTIGFRTVQPNRESKVSTAKQLVASLADIVIDWSLAISQFETIKLPKLCRLFLRSLDNSDRLHPHCRGALLSLVFNRGASFALPDDRYREMRGIAAAMKAGTMPAFATIPDLLRDMKRIWGATSSLSERRETEARLFEAGLEEMRLVSLASALISGSRESVPESAALREIDTDVPEPTSDDMDADMASPFEGAGITEAADFTLADVRWHGSDAHQPDYAHLDGRLAGTAFQLTPDDLDTLISANDFAPADLADGRPADMVFMLRGARCDAGEVIDAGSVTLIDQRPNHRDFRCVIGVYHRARRSLSVFPGSTVPNAQYVHRCYTLAGQPSRWIGNVLPTGCYLFTIGTHKAGQPGEIPEVLRLARSATSASEALVLRSLTDVVYDVLDHWHLTAPADNIHPGQMATGFSSAGCLTLPGFYRNGAHSGAWSRFRDALGLGPGNNNGRQFSGLLLTGLDAAEAVDIRLNPPADPEEKARRLRRLRHGSTGAAVGRLQAALGLIVEARPVLGPVTRQAFVRLQQQQLGWADGIVSYRTTSLLGLDIFG